MPRYEYKVVPAPTKANKIKGLKGTEQRFAAALAELMNEMGRDGWDYQRTDTLPVEERSGLTGKTTTFQNMLIFKRNLDGAAQPEPAAELLPAPKDGTPTLAVPTFRSTAASATPPAPSVPAPSLDPTHEGRAPRLGAAGHPEPSNIPRAPDIAAQ